MTEVTNILKTWEDECSQPNFDPLPTLTRLAEMVEVEAENYQKMDPDPFDERHPSRTDPECKFGLILKAIFRKDNFMVKLVNDYLRDSFYARLGIIGRDIDKLNIAACRLMLDIMPGLETSLVFLPTQETLILRLIKWTTNSKEPLQSYATGILAPAMEIPEIATKFREHNSKLVPLLLKRLQRLQSASNIPPFPNLTSNNRPFAHLSSGGSPSTNILEEARANSTPIRKSRHNGIPRILDKIENLDEDQISECSSPKRKRMKIDGESPILTESSPTKLNLFTETSNSSWAELETFMIGSVQIFPPTQATRQILILRYLAPMGEYQEFLSHIFENNALNLILSYVNIRETKEARLAFEALKYLSSLLCHKKFSIEFIHRKGLEVLLEVPRPSIAATGVSICLYYLGYCEEAMERVCLLPKHIISNLVKYALWLLECSHDSGRCHAIMFFGLTFQFRVILDEFDAQDGPRKLHNVISTLPILLPEADTGQLNEDQECAARQIVRHVCVAHRRYLEAHLYLKYEILTRSQMRPTSNTPILPPQPSYKACKQSPEEVQQQIETLLQNMPFRGHWSPVDQLLKLGCVSLLLKIIALAYEWNYSGRAETVRSALDVLAIACVMPKVQLLFCERVDLPEDHVTMGMNIILGAAEGEIVADADVQKAALRVLVNCVCGPIHRIGGHVARFATNVHSPNKKMKLKSSEDLMQRVWDCVRSNSGIMVLLQLMNVKTPITDADCIRTLACKALAGLARSETVRQIVSKLPLFTSGQLQNLMRDPILQEKRQEHVTFQKYALELLERLSGKTKHGSADLEISLAKIHRANVVAQTKIQFNEEQLLQLIHQHLIGKGLGTTASELVKEANLSNSIISNNLLPQPKFRYSSSLTPNRNRSSYLSLKHQLSSPQSEVNSNSFNNSQIKIIKKNSNSNISTPVQNSRLQKQITVDAHSRFNQSFIEESITTPLNPRISLTSIITEYLTNQHALCKNPMATCPQFNLFVPHKCPDPKPRIATASNFVIRCARRAIGYQTKNMDRKFIHSRFCPVQTIRSSSDEGFFTVAKFLPGDKNIIVGDYYGEIHNYNLTSGNEESSFQAHDNYIVHLEPSNNGEFLLTSSTWGRPISALWTIKDYYIKHSFEDEEYVEFSKLTQDKVLGTRGEVASLFDINTGQLVTKFVPTVSNQYTKNKATLNHQDDLILSDGVLFDVNSGKQIHKLDKLNQMQSGVFHPNGLEIVSNSEVWDMRTFHLLKTVPSLNQCTVNFSPVNHVIYASVSDQEMDDGEVIHDSSFKTVDAVDYSSIATIEVKKNIYDLAINRFDSQIALVENQGAYQSIQESVVRIYDVGRRREEEDEQDEEDDEEDMDGSDDDVSDNGDSLFLDLTEDNNDNSNNEDNGSESGSESWTSMSSSDSEYLDDSMLDDIMMEL